MWANLGVFSEIVNYDMKRLAWGLCGVLAFASVWQAKATTVFLDNFDTEHSGRASSATLSYNRFAKWSVSDGTVDLIGNGFFDFFPANGLYVDLDGSSFDAGIMTSIAISVAAGHYMLSFDLAGSQRGDLNTVHVNVSGGLASSTYVLMEDAPLTLETMSFMVGAPTTIHLSFANAGRDRNGAILDNVKLDRVSNVVPDSESTIVFPGNCDARIAPDETELHAPSVALAPKR